MTVYISTGGYSNYTAYQASKMLIDSNINSIELSGGLYSEDNIDKLIELKKKAKFQIHNYFPPPKIPFVLNLASTDEEVSKMSMSHIENSLRCCQKLGSNYYSFHAGFLCDLKSQELGRKIYKRKLFDREKSIDLFVKRINIISKKADEMGIKIMIENNVISVKNKQEFNDNPLLMCDPEESLKIFKQLPQNVKLLLDVAHLKVSAKSLSFKPAEMISKCDSIIGGYHLSDNDGLSDSNQPFNEDSWFWKYIKNDLEYYSIEVYHQPINQMKKLHDMLLMNLKKN